MDRGIKPLPLIALVASAFFQWWLWSRVSYVARMRDYVPPNSWHFENLGLTGAALVLAVLIIRQRPVWQRILACLLCVVPCVAVVLYFFLAISNLVEP